MSGETDCQEISVYLVKILVWMDTTTYGKKKARTHLFDYTKEIKNAPSAFLNYISTRNLSKNTREVLKKHFSSVLKKSQLLI